jgi:Leucine-rich repeat (LRR) protein
MPNLATLVIHDTDISEIPPGLQHKPVLDWADLSNNAITDVSNEMLALPREVADNIHLQGNPFTEDALQRLMAYYENTGVDFGIDEVVNQGEALGSTSPASEVDE